MTNITAFMSSYESGETGNKSVTSWIVLATILEPKYETYNNTQDSTHVLRIIIIPDHKHTDFWHQSIN